MNKKQWYESLFKNYAQKYDDEIFTQGTIGECDFIERELNSDNSLISQRIYRVLCRCPPALPAHCQQGNRHYERTC